MSAIAPITIAPDAMKIANFCQKSKLLAKNAKYNAMKAIQPKMSATVPETLAPNETMNSNQVKSNKSLSPHVMRLSPFAKAIKPDCLMISQQES